MARRIVGGAFVVGLVMVFACAEPTALVVEVHSEIPCSANAQVAIYGARTVAELATSAPSAFATRCDAETGGMVSRGSIVLTPTGSNDEPIAFAVVTRDDSTPVETGCAAGSATLARCISARRQIAFLPRTTMTMRVDLRTSCLGVTCGANETCVKGLCITSRVDVAQCVAGCDEKSVGDTADAGVPLTNPCAGGTFVGEFATWSGKVNVHRAVTGSVAAPWSVDTDCNSGANVNTVDYCKKFFPTTTKLVQYPAPNAELKPFTEAGAPPKCGKEWPDPGQVQFGCCAP